jgi:hypothetical protein
MVEDYAEKSFWLGSSGAYRENPPLGDLKCDVAIARRFRGNYHGVLPEKGAAVAGCCSRGG